MVLEKLGGSLREALRKIAGASYVDESLIKEIVRDIQRALIQADVNVQLALGITKQLQRRALEEKPPPGMSPREHVVRIIYEELVKILGATREVPLQKQRILLVGLYGQGKTTTAGKLAKFFQKKGLSVGLVAADVHRPAAYDQLKQLAEQINAPFHGEPGAKEAVKIAKAGVKALAASDVIIVDSSGRHALEPDLIAEIEGVAKAVQADERLLVLDATVGQQAGPQAKAFHDAVGITGVIVTKLDGTAKGGGALWHGRPRDAPGTRSRGNRRAEGRGTHEEDHGGEVHAPRDVRTDRDADGHGTHAEARLVDSWYGREDEGRGHGEHAGPPSPVQDHHGLHDRRRDEGPEAREVLPRATDRARRGGGTTGREGVASKL